VLRKEGEVLEAQRPHWQAAEQRARHLEGFAERVAGLAATLAKRTELERDTASAKDRVAAVERDHADTATSAAELRAERATLTPLLADEADIAAGLGRAHDDLEAAGTISLKLEAVVAI